MEKRKWMITAAILTVILIVWTWSKAAGGNMTALHEYPIGKYYRFEEIGKDGIIQKIVPSYNYLESIELFLVFSQEDENGQIGLMLEDEEGKEIFSQKYRVSEIPTGEVKEYKIGKRVKAGETYRLCISYEGISEELPQIMVSEKAKNLEETKEMMIEWQPAEYYNVAISYRYRWKSFWGFGY